MIFNRIYKTLISTCIFTGLLVSFFVLPTSVHTAGAITKNVSINNSSGSVQSNYSLEVSLSTSAEIIAGNMRSDCGDIRMFDTNTTTPLDFIVLNCNTSYTSVVFKVPSIPTGIKVVYLTYSDPLLTTVPTPPLNVFSKYEMFGATAPTCTLSGSAIWDSTNQWLQLTPLTVAANTGRCNYAGFIPGNLPDRGFKLWFDSFNGSALGTATGGQAIWQYSFNSSGSPTSEDNPLGGANFTIDENNSRMCYRGVVSGGGCSATYTSTNAAIANGLWRNMKATYTPTTKQLIENGTTRINTTAGTVPTITNTNFGFAGRTTATRAREHRVRKFAIIPFNGSITTTISNSGVRESSDLSFALRNNTDTAGFTNLCDFGTVNNSTIFTCGYRLKVNTSAMNGYSINVQTSGGLAGSSGTIQNALPGTGNTGGSLIAAGSELYGVLLLGGNCTNGTGTFSNSFSPEIGKIVSLNNTTNSQVMSCSGPNTPAPTDIINTLLVEHKLSIANDTPAGDYAQSVTWTVTPNF
jgi:hypothetical protein